VYGNLRLWIGAGLLGAGVLLLVDALIPSADVPRHVAQWWPLGLVILGVGGLIHIAWRRPAMLIPLAVVLVGSVLTLRTASIIPNSVDRFVLPILMSVAGAVVLSHFVARRRRKPDGPVVGRIVAVAEARRISWPHQEKSLAQLITVVSGCVVELPKPNGLSKARLEITAMFSGVEVLVPTGWRVEEDHRCIFGNVKELDANETDLARPLLQVESLVIGSRVVLARP
jgi:hypothetical protein